MKKLLIFLPLFVGLSACVNPPKGLEANDFTITNIKKIEADDYACQCKPVRLGGKVLSATALQHQTKLEILSYPVSKFSAKPVIDAMSDGRFISYVKGFVDPEAVKEQYVTVSGKLKKPETGKIDQVNYQYPVVQADQFKQWRLAQEYYYDYNDWDYWGYWGYGHFRHFGFGGIWREPKLRYRLY
ncbi:outer membrane lipoprotein [Cricetibacter osteomyelitidis]|uniref:Outer membrane lipoprotein n=1 Tax=Cricetibacter osteomyelitidis TaxID=1521931 RepID=A0A4R2SSW8_9PAST|nr:Slp family lipoprotein [Cricetibacter osteomyelitidis]TCP93457.1 outer membrane lipoprotein [Cricetibacter osteomyelitidis]